jgi:putative oxidoreductase
MTTIVIFFSILCQKITLKKEEHSMKILVLLGRIFYSAIFILSALTHFAKGTMEYAASHGVPMASILVPVSGIIAFVGGVSILVGYKARFGALMIVIFLVPVTLVLHRFWGLSDAMMAMNQQANFMKNLSMLGAALMIMHFGSGPLSVDK